MKMLTATVKNATLTPAEFNFFCFYLQMAWPCKQVDDGLVLESIPVEGTYYYPKKTDNIVTAEEFLRYNIRRICEKVLTHHGEAGDIQKSYSLDFSISEETPEETQKEAQGLDWILSHDEKFRYQLLDRMKSDCEYYLRHRHPKHLWAGNEERQIEAMKALWNSFPEEGKPEWLTWEHIVKYETDMKTD